MVGMLLGDWLLAFSAVAASLSTLYAFTLFVLSRGERGCSVGEKSVDGSGECSSITVVVAAYNEPIWLLKRLLEKIARARCLPGEIVVAWDGRSVDKSSLENACRETLKGKAKCIVDYSSVARGKPRALNEAVFKTSGECIVVLDVDDEPGDPNYFSRTASTGCSLVPYWKPSSPSTRLGEALAVLVEQGSRLLYSARCKLGLPILFLGSGSATSRRLLEKLRGWNERVLLEDVDYGIRMVLKGERPLFGENHVAIVGLPPTYTSFRKQQERWSRGALELFRLYARRIASSKSLRLREKIDLSLYLLQYFLSSLWPLLLVLGALLPHTHIVAITTSITVYALLALNAASLQETLSLYRRSIIGRLRLGGGAAAISATLTPRLLWSSILGLLGVKSKRTKTPKAASKSSLRALLVELCYAVLVLFSSIYAAWREDFTLASILLLYGMAPLYVAIRYRRLI